MQEPDRDGTASREQFRARQRAILEDEFALTAGEDAARETFEALALETYDLLADAGLPPHSISLDPESSFGFDNEREAAQALIPPALRRRWQAWKDAHRALSARFALHDLLHGIGATNDHSSWPAGLETAISDWIDGGQREPMPFDDRHGIVTPDFYERLRRARREAGGFFVYASKAGTRFLPEGEWQREKALQNAQREAQTRRYNEARRQGDRFQLKIARILTLARGEAGFWDALRSWERDRETHRPSVEEGGLTGPIAIGRRMEDSPATGHADRDAIPLDPLLADFVRRVHTPEDSRAGLTVALVVAFLRGTVRGELGLDGTLVWPGGPSLGEGRP